jgi:glycosyltransferase involved in cell wall biosynthesis
MRWAISYRNLRLPPFSKEIHLSGMPFDHARNVAVEHVMKGGFTWLFFLDDDVIIPSNAIERLASHGKDIISGLYYRRIEPIEPVMCREHAGRITKFNPGEMLEVDMVGAGCLLIHRRVFERIPKPWFEWLLDREDIPESQRASEDFAFCRKAKQYGFRIYVDTSIQCHHAGYGRSELGGHFRPLEV